MYQSDYKMITIKTNEITVEQYLDIRSAVNWRQLTRKQAESALGHSLIVVGAYEDDHLVGMGRIVGRWCGNLLCTGSNRTTGISTEKGWFESTECTGCLCGKYSGRRVTDDVVSDVCKRERAIL